MLHIYACLIAFALMSSVSFAAKINGAGSTFSAPLFFKWVDAYAKTSKVQINYQSIGSGAGVQQTIDGIVEFGASDHPLPLSKLKQSNLIQFPIAVGGIVVAVNLPGLKAGDLLLDGALLAAIFQGKIKKWNDKLIQELNPKIILPNKDINVLVRADGAGTTYNFTSYLGSISDEFKKKVGIGPSVSWPRHFIRGKGNEGVASFLKRIKYSLSYLEYSSVKENHMVWVKLINKDGFAVSPKPEAFREAAKSVVWLPKTGFNQTVINTPGANSWPICATTYIVVPRVTHSVEGANQLFLFFDWIYKYGFSISHDLGYLPIPLTVYKIIEQYWTEELRLAKGGRVWTLPAK